MLATLIGYLCTMVRERQSYLLRLFVLTRLARQDDMSFVGCDIRKMEGLFSVRVFVHSIPFLGLDDERY